MEMGLISRKTERKPSLTPKQKKLRTEEKLSWTMDGRMKVMLRDESPMMQRLLFGAGPFKRMEMTRADFH